MARLGTPGWRLHRRYSCTRDFRTTRRIPVVKYAFFFLPVTARSYRDGDCYRLACLPPSMQVFRHFKRWPTLNSPPASYVWELNFSLRSCRGHACSFFANCLLWKLSLPSMRNELTRRPQLSESKVMLKSLFTCFIKKIACVVLLLKIFKFCC